MGFLVGLFVGRGLSVGEMVGLSVGEKLGLSVGEKVGETSAEKRDCMMTCSSQ